MKANLRRVTSLVGLSLLGVIFSSPLCFGAPPVNSPTLRYPVGKITGSTVAFSWSPVSGATSYKILVQRGVTTVLTSAYTADQAGCSAGSGTCSVIVTVGFGSGELQWKVYGLNADGSGPWSALKYFTVADELRTPISSLPFTISSPGSYVITGNLNATGTGITVNSSNVSIDLNGYSIIGSGKGAFDGIYISDRSNVEIRNGTIRNFGRNGIYEAGSNPSGHRVIEVRANQNQGSGIALLGDHHLVKDCSAFGNGLQGISAYGMISGNVCGQNGTEGIYGGGNIAGNTARHNGVGIYAAQVGTLVSGNTAFSNDGSGIYIKNGFASVIGNMAGYNGSYGIEVVASGSLIKGNTAVKNTTWDLSSCSPCTLVDNYIERIEP